MNVFKTLLRALAALCLKLGLICLALATAASLVFGTSYALKQALRGSNFYNTAVDSIIDANKVSISQSGSSPAGLNDASIKQAAHTAFDPALIQSSTEQAIDGVYRWLEGKTGKPDFRIDLSAPKQRFAEAAADAAAARVQQLPACTVQQVRQLYFSGTADPFSLTCLPPGLNINQIRNTVISDVNGSPDFLKDPVITIDSLPKDSQGKSVFDNVAQAPNIFHWIMLAPWVAGGLTVLSTIVLLILYDEKRRSLRIIARALLGSGIVVLIGAWLSGAIFNLLSKSGGQLAGNGLQNSFISIFQGLGKTFSGKLIIFGIIYIALGVAIWVALHFTAKPKPPLAATPFANPTDLPDNHDVNGPDKVSEQAHLSNRPQK